jgi:alpha-L-rhamnosidase
MANIQGLSGGDPVTLARTSPEWSYFIADAWNQNAAPVHEWGLIGPTELLDLRRLPVGWQTIGFPDNDWLPAIPLSIQAGEAASIVFQPRSILPLANVRMPAALHDAGLISPGCRFGEIVPPVAGPYRINIEVPSAEALRIDTISPTVPVTLTVAVDGRPASWQAAGNLRVDVYQAMVEVKKGSHQVELANIPASGATICISGQGATFENLALLQGNHAGRRMLLAELIHDPGQVQIGDSPQGLRLGFSNLPAYTILDLGRTVHGRLQAKIEGPAGAILDIGWDERLRTQAQRPLPYLGSLYPQMNQVDSWILDGSGRTITTIDTRAGRYILIAVWGEGPIKIDNLQVFEERYPLEQLGVFHSSDPFLDRIWQVGIDTLRPNLTDAITDTPWRERGQWWGDVYAENRIAQVAFRDQTLLRRGLIYMADAMTIDPAPALVPNNHGLHMLDYSMLWVQDLAGYLRITQDLDFAAQMYPALERLMDHLAQLENTSTGLLDLPDGHWSVTAYIDVAGRNSRYGESTALNSIYARSLAQAAETAEFTNHGWRADQWREKAKNLTRAINSQLYKQENSRYWTNVYNEQFYEPDVYSQAWPLAYDIVPDDRRTAVADALLELISNDLAKPNIGTYGMLWVLEALGKAGYFEQALGIIRNYYGHMLSAGTSTWWEGFHANVFPETSVSHGWSGAPTWFLSTYILGARQERVDRWQVQPSFTGVDFASGVLPLSNGELRVHWERVACGEVVLKISSPEDTGGEAIFPAEWQELSILLDEDTVWERGMTGLTGAIADTQGVHIPLGSGEQELRARYRCP